MPTIRVEANRVGGAASTHRPGSLKTRAADGAAAAIGYDAPADSGESQIDHAIADVNRRGG
ncbi:hypothetical protein NX02_28825 [Sphingomonas sanxanigenens DSM 19645 = NX02]|uniref:Uncharacterized protein n=1 Tax=Sphingomonas sanxanigenens DSM 19645 = NX02 TaxID=1123269 RepID=W0ANM8_9SPHN|nr:hypothetical protein NX02_28825 [Sphingomonas sanxanigenens DSM 19645 = NX02]